MQAIQFTLMGLVTKNEYPKLAGLAQEGAFLVNYHLDMYQELKRLDAMEFVKPKKGQGLVDIQKQYAHRESDKFDLKYFVEITTRGREYLNLRDKITQAGLS